MIIIRLAKRHCVDTTIWQCAGKYYVSREMANSIIIKKRFNKLMLTTVSNIAFASIAVCT